MTAEKKPDILSENVAKLTLRCASCESWRCCHAKVVDRDVFFQYREFVLLAFAEKGVHPNDTIVHACKYLDLAEFSSDSCLLTLEFSS